ncbi:hypothetical protein V497_07114 [Pseudogymnoascus sp. VKM F-4516 (FW-969)]|nr:hypothetical protein V497_07114 [Pseudogymnoascus sp. VKM F-4516 (FW-969)]
MASVIQLESDVNNHAWGKKGQASLAARYADATPGKEFKVESGKDYSEMWIGTFPKTPSQLLSTGQVLQEWIDGNKEKLLGPAVIEKYGSDLPFLPKVISISNELPLQIHPDKELATKLHKHNPSKFGDPNHEPELTVALSDFEAFVGFKHVDDIEALFRDIPFLKERFTPQPKTPFTSSTLVKNIVHKLLSLSEEEVAEVYSALRDTPRSEYGDQSYILMLLPRISNQDGATDPGCLVSLLTMNFLTLKKGEALYIPADGIHAFLSGDIIECMAPSDNVINCGVCPSANPESINLFTSALTFDYKDPQSMVLRPKVSTKGLKGHTRVYGPPGSEFDMLVTELKKGEEEHIAGLQGPGIVVVTKGGGKLHANDQELELREGYAFFVGYDTDLKLVADEGEGLDIHMAFCEA